MKAKNYLIFSPVIFVAAVIALVASHRISTSGWAVLFVSIFLWSLARICLARFSRTALVYKADAVLLLVLASLSVVRIVARESDASAFSFFCVAVAIAMFVNRFLVDLEQGA